MSLHPIFDQPIARRGTGSMQHDAYGDGPEVIAAWVADMEVAAAPPVLDALRRLLDHGVLGYASATPAQRKAVVDWQADRHGWNIEPGWIHFTPGLGFALHVVGQVLGGSVLCPTPIYPGFLNYPKRGGVEVLSAPLVAAGERWELDYDRLASLRRPDTKLLLCCNPQNPVGQVFTRKELETVAEFCLRHDLHICSNEVWSDLILEPRLRHIPLASLSPEVAARTITLNAPSKAFNQPGLSCGYAIIPDPGLRSRWQQAYAGHGLDIPLPGLVALEAAYRHAGPWLDELRSWLRSQRDHLHARLAAELPNTALTAGQASYLLWMHGVPADAHARCLRAGLRLRPGAEFGDPHGIRLNFACPRPRLDQIIDRLVQALR